MKKPINEIERLKLIAGLINEVDYSESVFGIKSTKQSLTESHTKEAKADEAVKAEVKAKKVTPKAPKELHIDQANPYEYRHGLQYELGVDSDYSDESLAAAKAKVLKNLAKDSNYYSTLLNQKQSHYEFKAPETDAPGMQANADGTLKKGAGKLEKANVKDSLGKKEAGKVKPKGVKIMPDKGVTGSTKTIKEGAETDIENKIKSGEIKPEEVKKAAEKAMNGDSTDLALMMAGFGKMAEDKVEEGKAKGKFYAIFDKARGEEVDAYDTEEEAQAALDKINKEDPHHGDYVIDDNTPKDKHAKIKEALKKGLKELINPNDIRAAKASGDVVNIPAQDTAAQTAAKNAKINFRTYK